MQLPTGKHLLHGPVRRKNLATSPVLPDCPRPSVRCTWVMLRLQTSLAPSACSASHRRPALSSSVECAPGLHPQDRFGAEFYYARRKAAAGDRARHWCRARPREAVPEAHTSAFAKATAPSEASDGKVEIGHPTLTRFPNMASFALGSILRVYSFISRRMGARSQRLEGVDLGPYVP